MSRTNDELHLIAAIADELPVGVWVATVPDGSFAYANRAFSDIMGMGPEPEARAGGYSEPYGIFTRSGELYPEQNLPFARALRAGSNVVVDDIVIHRRDGRRVYVRAFARPLRDSAGTMTHIAIAFIDISDEARAEEERERSEKARMETDVREHEARVQVAAVEERLANVLRNAPIVLWAIDPAGNINLCEGRGLDKLGSNAEAFLGRTVSNIYPNEPALLASIHRALAGETFTATVRVSGVTFDASFTPMRGPNGEVVGVLGVSTDVSDREAQEERLRKAERLASMGALAATVAHEINNPLTYVMGNLEMVLQKLAKGDVPREELRSKLNLAREGADRVRQIVRGLKAFSRNDDEPVGPTDVQAVIEQSLSLAENEIRHRARLVRDYGRISPASANHARLAQVFVNLLVNAAHAIAEGHADDNEIRVTTSLDASRTHVVVSIADTGAGIPKEVREHLFEPFFTTKPVGVGTGLGLSVCHGIVSGFGGRIEVESVVGKGTVFKVFLRAATADASPRARSGEFDRDAAPPSARRGRLLIVDDDQSVAKSLRMVLEEEHDVEVSTQPKRALEMLLGGRRFDLIFCDLMMPEMTGMELHAALAEALPEQAERMVFVTGGAFTHAAQDFLRRVPNPRLEKPFDPNLLGELTRRKLGVAG